MAISVRAASEADLPGLLASSGGLWREDAGARDATMNLGWPHQYGATAWRTALADPSHLVLVADAGSAIVGHLSASLAEPTEYRLVRVATIGSLYVFPPYRRAGVGAEMVAQFRQWAGLVSADRIAVTAYATNQAAIRFYHRVGFGPYSVTLEGDP
jgi:GNAT superfamily N-acetyltransferase